MSQRFSTSICISFRSVNYGAPKDIHADMVATLGDDAPALSTVQKWAAEFKRGRESLEDDPRSGRPVTATTRENIDRVHHMVMDDSRLTVNQIANAVGISRERVENILHNELGMSKISARWVPRLLTPDQKHTRLVTSQANLALFEANPDDFLERSSTVFSLQYGVSKTFRFLSNIKCYTHFLSFVNSSVSSASYQQFVNCRKAALFALRSLYLL
uniref:Mos1 transposase HTH domain-containing protein n=1 Tax=Amphilophus citrinellus TaxID=61819 RepID=A0A3Q0T381_AMPCI